MKHGIRSWCFIIYLFLFEAIGHGIFPVADGDFLRKSANPPAGHGRGGEISRHGTVGARHASPAILRHLSGINRRRDCWDREKPSPGGEGVTPFGVTDEVEGNSVVPTYGDNRQLRPHQSQLTLRQLPLQGKPFAPLFLRMKFVRAGHAAAPTLRNDTASRPSSVCPAGSRLLKKPAQGSFALGG